MSPSKLADNTQFYIEALFKLLGIDYAADGDKAPPFSSVFKSLGLQFDLTNVGDGQFTLGHTETRRQELLEQIRHLTQTNGTLVNIKELERLHGRLVWLQGPKVVDSVLPHSLAKQLAHQVTQSLANCNGAYAALFLGEGVKACAG